MSATPYFDNRFEHFIVAGLHTAVENRLKCEILQ